MSRTREQIIEERRRLKAAYRELYKQLLALFFRHDPKAINYESNTDEYSPEVGTILPRLRDCRCVEDVQRVVHEEFLRWFGSGEAGTQEDFKEIPQEIWQLWQKFNASKS